MTGLVFLIVAGAVPFIPGGMTLTQQVHQAVGEGVWVDWTTLETGVSWERAA